MNPDDSANENSAQAPFASKPRKARFNLTALVSLLMFLLVTFVLFGMSLVRTETTEVKLPFGGCGCGGTHHQPMVVQVSSDGLIFVNREAYDISELPRLLAVFKEVHEKIRETPRVIVTGDDRAKYGSMVKVIDYVKTAGIAEMSVETNYRASGM